MNTVEKKIDVRIAYDGMAAYVKLAVIDIKDCYTVKDICAALEEYGIVYGIDRKCIENMVRNGIYDCEVKVAKGLPVKDAVDAHFEFLFDTETHNKPKILPDGSVDYWSIKPINIVHMGQQIMLYKEAEEGEDGIDVRGRTVKVRKPKTTATIQGRGFSKYSDGYTYLADMDGKVEIVNNRVIVSPILEIDEDVDVRTGDIDFRGDVVIHGSVRSGRTIKSGGTVTVDGTVEACTIIAKKDIVLRGGFLGGNRGYIKCAGNVTAQFIEYAKIEADGYISATSLLNCDIISYDTIYIKGHLAHVVGGRIYGAGGVVADSFGNQTEIKTTILTGVHQKLLREILILKSNIIEEEDLYNKAEYALKELEKHPGVNYEENRIPLLRTKVSTQADLNRDKAELKRLEAIIEKSKSATVKAARKIFPGVEVAINDIKVQVREQQDACEFIEQAGMVRMYSLADIMVG